MTDRVALAIVALAQLVLLDRLVRLLVQRQDRYVAASLVGPNPVASAVINQPETRPVRNARDEAKEAGVNPPTPFFG